MNVKKFIDRPVLATVIAIFIVLGGLLGLSQLPVEQYPDIAPPTISVSTSYPGANAETIQKSVIAPLEEAINGVENMTYMKSDATNSGQATISIFFKQGTDPDMAAVNVQNRVATATALLPAEVNQIGVTTSKKQSSMLKIFSLVSTDGRYDEAFLSNYFKINIQPAILRIQGVGACTNFGADYSMRIWLKPDRMAQYGLNPGNIAAILADQNIEAATGKLGENSDNAYQFTLKFKGRNVTEDEFENLVIKSLPNGDVLRMKEVADLELGKNTYSYIGKTNGAPASPSMIFQTAGSNATEVIKNIDSFLESIEEQLPEGVEIVHMMSSNDFLEASINNVLITLLEAILLVILIVYLFLQDLRSTLIPSISIVVSLIGTFAVLMLAGFSLNLLTLFALVLAIGTVVDDAIVVVEAVQTRFDNGYKSAYLASVDAMKGLTSPIITTSLVFMAVFIPVAFMGGTAGIFYTQFGITMSIAVAISTINALTLSPALCALLLKPVPQGNQQGSKFAARIRTAYDVAFSSMLGKYMNALKYITKHRKVAFIGLFCVLLGLGYLVKTTRTGLVPDEDLGVVFVNITTEPGSTLNHTHEVLNKVEQTVQLLPQVKAYTSIVGYGLMSGDGANNATIIVKLNDWKERKERTDAAQAVIGAIFGMTANETNAQIFVFAPGMIPGYGMGNGFEMYVQDKNGNTSVQPLFETTQAFIRELSKRPEIGRVFSSFNTNFPQYDIEVDAVHCQRMGVSQSQVLSTMSGYFGSAYISNFNRFSKVYRVMMQARPEYRLNTESLEQIFITTPSGQAPLSQFVKLTPSKGAEALNRLNMFNAIAINGVAAPGYSSGEAIAAINEVAADHLPRGYGFDFGGITREESQNTDNTVIIFAICIVMVYLILAALYESFFIPIAVILSLPFGLAGSFLFAKIMGVENNIYLQTGLIMLIGLLAKTAILLTEYASELRAKNMSIVDAAIEAARVRFRPILMTALTMIFGLLPMMFANGVGANGNISLATGVVGGMLVGTFTLVFVVPCFFIFFQKIEEKVRKNKHVIQQDTADC